VLDLIRRLEATSAELGEGAPRPIMAALAAWM
jgi:hypothetical protein